MKHPSLLLGLVFTASAPLSSGAVTVFSDRTLFELAGGSGLQFEGFDEIPTDETGQAAFSNGASFGNGAFTLQSLTLPNDVALSSGFVGTFLVRTNADPNIDQWIGPGGANFNTGDPRDDDDFRIQFVQPVTAFGILIYDNRTELGETIRLYWDDNSTPFSLPLPGTNSGTGGHGFLGFVVDGSSPIRAVEILEGQTINDDIGFDWVYFNPVPEPSAAGLFALGSLVLIGRRRKLC